MAKQDTDNTKVAVSTRVSPELKAELEKLAELHGSSVAAEVATALEHYVDAKKVTADKLTEFSRTVLKAVIKDAKKRDGRTTPGRIVTVTGLSIKTVAATSGQLMAKGLIRREQDKPEDGPAVNYLLPTPEGEVMVAQL